ncbi:MAG: phosphotransferase family protein [Microthrixaceae bacterium]
MSPPPATSDNDDKLAPEGIDPEGVERWFAEHVPSAGAPLTYSLIAGGHSNLTFSVTDRAGSRWVLRRPPLGQVLASAHDMGREHKIISALGPTDVPVPHTEGLCEDPAVNGAPFYVMDFVEGSIVRSTSDAEALSPDERRRAGESLVDVLADIHAVDVDAAGLGDLGRKSAYIERQLKRWNGQFDKSDSQVPGGLGLDSVSSAHDRLTEVIPEQHGAAIVHGDYRLDNCMLGPDGSVVAVLDWEICTLGDPMADIGLLWVYWTNPGDAAVLPQASPTALEGFVTKDELVTRYAQRSGRDCSGIDFYIAFGYWKLTCIIAGVYARYAGGAMGDVPEEQVNGFRQMLDSLADRTTEAVGEL